MELNIAKTEDVTPLTGDWGRSDLAVPRLTLIQPTSQLDDFPKGALVYDRELMVSDGATPVTAYVLHMHKYYEEELEYGADEQPKRWNTSQEAEDDGYSPKWNKNAEKKYGERADVIFLVECDMEFAHYEHEGKGFVKAVYTFKSTAYNIAKRIYTAINNKIAGGVPHKVTWELGSEKKDNGKNKWFVPTVSNKGATPEEVVTWIETEVL